MPSSAGFLTCWPTGQSQPYISNVNYEPGRVIPNLVLCKVGAGGKVSIYVSDGDVDLIADVVGCFTGGGVRHSAGARRSVCSTLARASARRSPRSAPVARSCLQVVGHGGVPASAQAVVLNVTATNATADTYITSYPSGSATPECVEPQRDRRPDDGQSRARQARPGRRRAAVQREAVRSTSSPTSPATSPDRPAADPSGRTPGSTR